MAATQRTIKKGPQQGDVTRSEAATEPPSVAVAIVLLSIIVLYFSVAFIIGLFAGGNTIATQQVLALDLGGAFIGMAFILSLYRRYFLPDVMVVKKRRDKYEDL
ncbi:MAG: hypothetical protein HY556_01240 [Euryarchaeota archaeon]|nr:hypothetical protein [Euryarchaeota archaeon]